MSLVLPIPDDLKGRVELALAREYYKDPLLKSVTPALWRATARKKATTLAIQANPDGDSMVTGLVVFTYSVNVSVQGRVTKVDPFLYIAAVEKIHAGYGALYVAGDVDAYRQIFDQYGILVYGAWPRTMPAAIQGTSHVDNTALSMVVCKL